MAEGDINVTRKEPVSRRDREEAEVRDRASRDFQAPAAIAAETAFEFSAATYEMEVGVPFSADVEVKTVDAIGGAPITNYLRDGDDGSFGVTVAVTAGSAYFLTEDGRATSQLLTNFRQGKARFTIVADDPGAVTLGLVDSESTGLTVTDTATLTAA